MGAGERMVSKEELANQYPHLADFLRLLEHLNRESERGQVLICSAFIDDLLVKVIHAFLIEGPSANKLLNGFNAPLGSFSARIEAAFAMGLIISPEYQDAQTIRKIRNEFAHAVDVSFQNPKIKQLCANLNFSAKDYKDVVVAPRGQFSSAATGLILNLTNRPHYVSQSRLRPRRWPY